MKIETIEFITTNKTLFIQDLEVEDVFKSLNYNCIKSILKTSWKRLNKFKIMKVLMIGFMRKLFGKRGITRKMQREIMPHIIIFPDKDINYVKITFTNNKTLIFNTLNIDMIDILQDIYDVIHTNQYDISEQNIKNKIVVDCGANKGVFSLFAVLFGAKKVYSFEPVISSNRNMSKTIKLNNVKNIILSEKALGEANYNSKISFRYTGDGGSQINSHFASHKDWKSEEVEIVKLDDCNLGEINFIKIDTEGFEANVLKGATETIKEYKPILSLSAYHKPEDKKELPKLIKSIRSDYNIKLNKFSEEDFYCWVNSELCRITHFKEKL